ncbi:MAG: VOC family protein [Erysipelotrichaceae bacterium]|jgi:lactoylglutathione lyase
MKIEHIAMYVCDLEGAKDFFLKYFDGNSNEIYINEVTGFKSYFISFNGETRLEIMSKVEVVDSKKEINRTGYSHVAFSTGSKERVNKLTERLRSDGFKIISGPRTTGDGYYESCIVGFENNQIEITV